MIQFGKNSFVVSLPKPWVERNKLSKGSDINIEESAESLIIGPNETEEKQPRIKKISCDESKTKIGRSIISAYINNYNIIEIYGQTLQNYMEEIEQVTQSLVALEIMEQTPKKVIIKDFLNTHDISIDNIIKRMDIIIRAMLSEVQEMLEKNEKINLDKRDLDINRLFYVGQKLINKLLDSPQMSKTLNMSLKEAIFYWQVLDALEKIADQQKRVARNINELDKTSISKLALKKVFALIVDEYLVVIKSLYSLDKDRADKILSEKGAVLRKCDEIVEKYINKLKEAKEVHNTTEAVEKLKRFENYITQLAKAIIGKDDA